ncbi:nucleotidyltransferase family protein [Sphingorhabdus sp. IMCC26285]|uniref:Nucleotidyltransferase family protein n=1 Tax=Sphingorhabdus profundilacus TaxID=2509718 RepID=A0A6I4LX17_9SPHN|nr:nucleotidyltransferase family protein [Sphingorhabdus profundilacus]MVZ96660.1 nucleotidyltransferase family protein [Sphingorhabdus profundilacus]
MSHHVNTAMIMAAGKGTRMMPLTADRPKPLVEVAGTALLDHVLDHLRDAGVGQIVINAHYRASQVEDHMADHAADFEVAISDERDLLLDTGGGLVRALPLIPDDPFICVNADNWWTNDGKNAFTRLMAAWDDDAMDVLMLLIPYAEANNTQGQGDFDLDADGRLSRRKADQQAAYVWTGIQMLSKRLIIDPPSEVFSTNVFWDRAIAKGRCHGLVHQGLWFDVGYPDAIAATEAKLMSHAQR